MIGLSEEELTALVCDMEEAEHDRFPGDTPRDQAGEAVISFETSILLKAVQLVALNNQRLYENLVALGVLERDGPTP